VWRLNEEVVLFAVGQLIDDLRRSCAGFARSASTSAKRSATCS
jgi:hypothetical protein